MTQLGGTKRRRLLGVLERGAELGWLGPGPVDSHVGHALGFVAVLLDLGDLPGGVLDLGSGGGVPGLVVAVALAPLPVTLLDGSARRCALLRTAAGELGDIADIRVAEGRAEELGRTPELAARFAAVTARSFGPPPVTAECATGFLRIGGRLLVSEPPPSTADAEERWDAQQLANLGLAMPRHSEGNGPRIAVLEKIAESGARYPRRAGVPAKRPLW